MASQCQHIMATGVRCATPPVKSHKFCYHQRRMHDTYSLPGDSNYKPEVLDSPEAVTITLHHLELAMNKGRMTVREFRARLFLVQLAIANLRRAAAATAPPPDAVLTQYTPAMRDLHHLNSNQPCETAETICEKCHAEMLITDTLEEPDEPVELAPLVPPCPIEWLQPRDLPEPKDNSRLWYPLTSEELLTYQLPGDDELGTLEQEHQLRRMKLSLRFGTASNPTAFQIDDQIAQIEKEEHTRNPGLAINRELQFTGQLNRPASGRTPTAATNW